jgi:hypothetical protein
VKQKKEWMLTIPPWMVTVTPNMLRDYSMKVGKAFAYLRKDEEREDGIEEESEEESRQGGGPEEVHRGKQLEE